MADDIIRPKALAQLLGMPSRTLGAIQGAFAKAGVLFLDPGDTRHGGHGVRMRKP
jgi:hypothetical protein